MVNIQKAAVIGCGFVGSTIAYTLMQKGLFSEMVLLDANKAKAEGEAMDISHGLPFTHAMDIYAGEYEDIADASVVIITAGANQKPGETRLDLVQEKKAEIVKGNAAAEFDGEITFTYCTEFIVNKAPDAKSPVALRAYLESIGDSAVVVDDDNIIKVHVHTDNPGNAIQEGLKYGYLTNMKIDNMREQHETKAYEAKQSAQENDYQPVDPEKAYGFVAVAAGQGLQALFTDLGVDKVVSGGQTMNPSTEDILSAIHATPAETVFVLPNNKNIIMAAEQAAKLADRRVCVLQTRTIPQGLTAMLAFDPDATYTDNRVNMTNAFAEVQTGQVTFAARDSDYDGHNIKQGEILGLENGKLAFTEKDITKAVYKLIKSLVKRDSSFVTMIYGADVSDAQAEKAYEAISAKLGDSVEINLINGGQPVYYYIVSVE